MTEGNRPLLPNWPRLMPAGLAASYVGWSRNGFLRRVGQTWPKPIRLGGKVLWDRTGLDKAVDQLVGCGEPSGDPIMEAIKNGYGAGAKH